jgi:hypothetical protein
MSDATTAREIQQPAPRGGRVSTALLLLGIAAGPAAWSLQLLAKYTLTVHYCFPGDTPHAQMPPGLGWVWPMMVAIDGVMLLVAAGGAGMSFRHWRITGEEAGGRMFAVAEGRARFLAVWGMLTGSSFFLAIVIDLVALLLVPLCG